MQHVTAFSRPETVPPVPAIVPKRNVWILDSWRDLILYVGTPLLIIPLFVLAQARWSAQEIYLFVAAFGAMGHHLPGMIRAYGDRAIRGSVTSSSRLSGGRGKLAHCQRKRCSVSFVIA